MFLTRHLKNIPKISINLTGSKYPEYSHNYTTATPTPTTSHIEIPKRIPRSSTDILHALASTVKGDPTATHYKFHDDPYLIPASNSTKRTFAMAQESGRKAAKWIKEQHRDLFMHQEAQPPIKDFAPKMVFSEESDVSATDLAQLINQSEVNDAVLVYNLMQQKNIPVSDEHKQSLLELLAFYNHEEPLPVEYFEERWFKENTAARERQRKMWKDGDLAEKLFAEIEVKTPATYAALIRGMAKYNQAQRAHALFEEALEKQMEMDTNTYNAIIKILPLLKETYDERWALCQELLQKMAQQELKPNLDTLNALLQTIASFGNYKLARGCCMKVLAEFKHLNIAPSLASYYYILNIFCRERSPVSHVLVDILRECEGKAFKIAHERDTSFFSTAMDVCRNHLNDKNLAQKVNDLLHTANNYDLIGDSFKESMYYRHYFVLLSQTLPLEDFMPIYDQLVPNIYTPEPGIMEEILKTVENHGAAELVPRFWSDLIIFDYVNRESLLTRCLNIMMQNKPVEIDSPLHEQFAKVALDIFKRIIESDASTRTTKLTFNGRMLGDILTLLVRGNVAFDEIGEVFTYADKNQHRIAGTPTEVNLIDFIDACIQHKAPSQAVQCLQYSVENNMDAVPLAQRINKGFTLNEVHLSKVKSLVGDEFMTLPAQLTTPDI